MGFGTNMNKLGSGVSFLLVAIFVLVSILVSVFSSYYFTSTLSEQKAQELVQLFSAPDTSFDETAKNILNSRQDVLYIKLLDSEGVLQESFGSEEGENIEMLPITTSENSTILLGLVGTDFKNLIIYTALWSALIGLVVSIIVLFILSLLSNGKSDSIEKIISGMKRVSRGDSTTKLESSEAGDDVTMIRAYETFNQMLDMLKRRENVEVEEPIFQPTLIATEEKEEETNTRRVTVIVAKIADFQDLSSTLDSTELNSFLADYRKYASSIISNYGGVIEALMKEEIVAFFNVPEEQTNPELRAICSAVEVLQHLATITRERKLEGKIAINGKIGIGTKTLNVYSDSGVPQGIKGVTDTARSICDISPIWKVIVSSELYLSVSEYVEARELTLGEESYYSIVGVEEGIV